MCRSQGPVDREPTRSIERRTVMKQLRWIIALSTLALASCGGNGQTGETGDAAGPSGRLEVIARAGPVCPVETDPPSPECAPRPVDSATIIVTDATGDEVARGTTGPDGVVVRLEGARDGGQVTVDGRFPKNGSEDQEPIAEPRPLRRLR